MAVTEVPQEPRASFRHARSSSFPSLPTTRPTRSNSSATLSFMAMTLLSDWTTGLGECWAARAVKSPFSTARSVRRRSFLSRRSSSNSLAILPFMARIPFTPSASLRGTTGCVAGMRTLKFPFRAAFRAFTRSAASKATWDTPSLPIDPLREKVPFHRALSSESSPALMLDHFPVARETAPLALADSLSHLSAAGREHDLRSWRQDQDVDAAHQLVANVWVSLHHCPLSPGVNVP